MDTQLLLLDTLAFLCWLKDNDIRPRGKRWLPPKALAQINSQLLVRDTVRAPVRSNAGGRIGTRELDTERIRFIHFLCESGRLTTGVNQFLKPALRVKRWLTATSFDQLQQLFVAAFPDRASRDHDNLWRTYRLPGWSLASPTLKLIHPLLDVLRAAPDGERLKITTLLKLIPLPADGDEAPEDMVRGMFRYLEWLAAAKVHGNSILTLTELGTTLLNRARTQQHPRAFIPNTQPTLEIDQLRYTLADPDALLLYQLTDYATLTAVKPRRRYRLNRQLVQQALQRGDTLDHIVRFLERALGDALAATILTQLYDWAADLDQARVSRVVLLEVKDPALLTELARSQRFRESVSRTLSPRAVVIREAQIPVLLRQFKRQGLMPRLGFPARQRLALKGQKFLKEASTAHLYFALQLNYLLSDRLPAPYRVPYSLILDLERQLTPADRDLASQLAEEAAKLLTPEIEPHAVANEWSPAGENPAFVEAIEQAIDTATALTITYYTAGRDTTTQRMVEPLRLEWRNEILYLIAYCHLRQDERVFRVDRISEIKEA